VLEDIERLVVGQPGVEQCSALAFGEAFLTGTAGEQTPLVGTVAEADPQIVETALAVEGASGVLAAEKRQVIHAYHRSKFSGWVDNASLAL
jgi:hypothetical protein